MKHSTVFTSQDLAEGLFYYGVVFFLTLCFVIFVHEFGHYCVARRFGVRITKFSIGFGKEICGFNDRHGTRWCLSWIPLGGYVSIFGDVDPDNPQIWDKDKNEARRMTDEEFKVSFCSKSIAQRALIVAAGPFINVLLTYIVMVSVYMTIGHQYAQPVIYAIGVNTAADKAGFELGDRILAMNNMPIEDISKIYEQTFDHSGEKFHFDVLRGEEKVKLTLVPVEISYTDEKGVDRKHGRTGMVNFQSMKIKDFHSIDGQVTRDNPQKVLELLRDRFDKPIIITFELGKGVDDKFKIVIPKKFNAHLFDDKQEERDDTVNIYSSDEKFFHKMGVLEASSTVYSQISKGLDETYKLLNAIYNKKSNEKIVSGVGDVSKKIGNAAKEGFYNFFLMLAMLSFMIALINIMPIPLFDGGYLLFLLIEAVRGKPVSQKIQSYAAIFGLVLIGGIMVFANVSDFIQLFG